MKMVSLRDIKALYETPDLLHNSEERNFAVDISARTRAIRLLDGHINYTNGSLYVPGTSYLLTYKEAEKTVKSRKRVAIKYPNGVEINIFPKIVEAIVHGEDYKKVYSNVGLVGIDRDEFEGWMEIEGIKELNNFAEIYKAQKNKKRKVDKKGLILVQNVDPITPFKNDYEREGISHIFDPIGRLNTPLEIRAAEAEMTFMSDDYTKITDSDGDIGKYKDGILTLANPSFVVHGIDDTIKKKFSRSDFRRMVGWSTFGIGFFGMLGAIGGGGIAFVGKLISDALDKDNRWVWPFWTGGITISSLLGAVVGFTESLDDRNYQLSGSSLMRIAYYGTVKDKRFENLEEMLA